MVALSFSEKVVGDGGKGDVCILDANSIVFMNMR